MTVVPWYYELLDKHPEWYVPIIIVGVYVCHYFLNPLVSGTIFRGGKKQPEKWDQIVDGEAKPSPKHLYKK